MPRLLVLLLVVVASLGWVAAVPLQLYDRAPGSQHYTKRLVAVSSTVIPLDDLPSFTVSSFLGPFTESPPLGVVKPQNPTKLLTAANRKKESPPAKKASVFELTKEEFNNH